MSTRCQIGFYREGANGYLDFEALIYRHSDGYPASVLPDIIPFLTWWDKARGLSDLEYCSARLLQYLCNEYDGRTSEYMRKFPAVAEKHAQDLTGTLGHGICKRFQGDIEYFYYITPTTLKVYAVGFDEPSENWKLIKEINLKQEAETALQGVESLE